MIIRLILLFVIVAILMWLIKRLFGDATKPDELESRVDSKSENMLQCKFCGIHVPESSIVSSHENPYCCEDHANRDQQ